MQPQNVTCIWFAADFLMNSLSFTATELAATHLQFCADLLTHSRFSKTDECVEPEEMWKRWQMIELGSGLRLALLPAVALSASLTHIELEGAVPALLHAVRQDYQQMVDFIFKSVWCL